MKLSSLLAAALLSAASVAGAAEWDLGEYKVTYDETTDFGWLSSAFGSGTTRGFSWTVPNAVQVVSVGTSESMTFDLPSFTVTANPGYFLTGPISAFLGNLVFNELGGATTTFTGAGEVSVDGSPSMPVAGALDRTVLASVGSFVSGYYSGSGSVPYGPFTSLTVSNASITLMASGGTFASIIAQPQNKLEYSFDAMPVPEPQTYAMLLAGMATLGWLVRRRQSRG